MPPNPCCQNPANLTLPPDEQRPGVTVRQCQVCQRRHYEMSAEPALRPPR